jgi:tetratricopeptide (TPR) repeat protein
MAAIKNINEAKKMFRRRRYAAVLRGLEPEIFRFRESAAYFRLLGLSCLYLQDGGGAYSYLNRALQIKEDDVPSLLGVAAIHVKKRNLDDALKIWLRVLEIDPSNRTARRGLHKVRKGMGEDKVSRLVDSGGIRMFYPPQPAAIRPVMLVAFLVALAAAGGIIVLAPRAGEILSRVRPDASPDKGPPERRDIAAVELSANAMRTDSRATARFMFTETQVDAVWNKAKDLFMAYRDNAAVYQLNRLLLSNASPYIKESSRRLKALAQTPGYKDFVSFRDNYPLAAVRADPLLYDGCFVLWRGTIANLYIGGEDIRFQLLVGSHDNRSFEGAVPVIFDFAEKFQNNYYIELLGRVTPRNGGFFLKGVLFRRLIPDHPVDESREER